jgi:hypothetical protein
MKILSGTLLLLILATSCDSPQRNRLATTVNNGNGLSQPNGATATNPWGTAGTTGGSSGGTSGSGSGTSTRPPGFDNCDITAKYYAAGINYMGICQSTLDETSVAVNSTVSDSARTCLIPTYKDQSGSSTYLGNPQCFAPAPGVVMGQLAKTRSGFTDKALNGVMVIKEASITAYYRCMNFYIDFPASECPNGRNTNQYCAQLYQQCYNGANTNSYCAQKANSDMAIECNNFKSNHAYIDIRLK